MVQFVERTGRMEMGKVRGVKCFVNLFNGLPALYSVSRFSLGDRLKTELLCLCTMDHENLDECVLWIIQAWP